ncbi:hypothetical protein [Paraburkholderia kururiensis]|uniref:hypothetical protein n=1 Tax=Paraburkholderia kururiensis TaxID=984307 RepID=UPI00034A729F|nr:hypothetical protein [Paraburkholderia kururiensis]
MTVAELIELLQKHPPHHDVFVSVSTEYGNDIERDIKDVQGAPHCTVEIDARSW